MYQAKVGEILCNATLEVGDSQHNPCQQVTLASQDSDSDLGEVFWPKCFVTRLQWQPQKPPDGMTAPAGRWDRLWGRAVGTECEAKTWGEGTFVSIPGKREREGVLPAMKVLIVCCSETVGRGFPMPMTWSLGWGVHSALSCVPSAVKSAWLFPHLETATSAPLTVWRVPTHIRNCSVNSEQQVSTRLKTMQRVLLPPVCVIRISG